LEKKEWEEKIEETTDAYERNLTDKQSKALFLGGREVSPSEGGTMGR